MLVSRLVMLPPWFEWLRCDGAEAGNFQGLVARRLSLLPSRGSLHIGRTHCHDTPVEPNASLQVRALCGVFVMEGTRQRQKERIDGNDTLPSLTGNAASKCNPQSLPWEADAGPCSSHQTEQFLFFSLFFRKGEA